MTKADERKAAYREKCRKIEAARCAQLGLTPWAHRQVRKVRKAAHEATYKESYEDRLDDLGESFD